MIFTADRAELSSAISRAAQGLPPNPAQPIYAGMHLETDLDADLLHLTASDGEVQFTSYCPVTPLDAKDGCVLPGRLLSEMSAYFGGKEIRVERDGSQVTISSGRSRFTLNAIDADLYPRWENQAVAFLQLDGEELARALRSVVPAATDTGLAQLSGIHIETEGDTLILVCTDTSRIAVAEVSFTPVRARDMFPASTLLPSRTGGRFARDVSGPTGIGWNDSLIFMQHHGGTVLARRIGGTFMPWRNPFARHKPEDWFAISPKELTRAVRMAQLAGDAITCVFEPSCVTVRAGEQGRECTEQVECGYAGERRELCFGGREVLDGLAGCGDTTEMALSIAPLYMRSGGFRYMIGPRRGL